MIGVGSRFKVATLGDESIVVVFEPLGIEVQLATQDHLVVEWQGDGEGEVSHAPGVLSIWDPTGGRSRAWTSDGTEIHLWD